MWGFSLGWKYLWNMVFYKIKMVRDNLILRQTEVLLPLEWNGRFLSTICPEKRPVKSVANSISQSSWKNNFQVQTSVSCAIKNKNQYYFIAFILMFELDNAVMISRVEGESLISASIGRFHFQRDKRRDYD